MGLHELQSFELGDWGESDGIGECEETIKASGGLINKGIITLYKDMEVTVKLRKAVDYLCNEWDYACTWEDKP